MADIRPFRGVRYNQSVDLSKVICPPYDIIPPEMQQELYRRSELNFIRLEYPLDGDDTKYARCAALMQDWLAKGVLKTDPKPALYLHEHSFSYEGKQYTRRHILARVRLEEWDTRVVRPHEGTLPKSRSDRLSLLEAVRANTSPILALYEDNKKQVAPVLEKQAQQKPLVSFNMDAESHSLWAIADSPGIDRLREAMELKPLYIADGHHRYESALTYRREVLNLHPTAPEDALQLYSGQAPFNFVLMSLVDFADPGLVILPPHRLVRGLSKAALSTLMPRLATFFDIEEIPLNAPDVWQRVDRSLAESDPAADEVRLAVFGLTAKCVLLLRLRDFSASSQLMPAFHSDLYKKLDVSIVDHVILEQLAEMSVNKEEIVLAYSHRREDAVNGVLDGEYQLTILLNPVKAATIKAIADAGDRMPRKSTYFYPKAPAGLVVNRLVE